MNDFYNITLSKDLQKKNLTEYFKKYTKLTDTELDDQSYISHLINVISSMDVNQTHYTNMAFRENNLSLQKNLSSVKNIAKYLSFDKQNIKPSSGILSCVIDFSKLQQYTNSEDFEIDIPYTLNDLKNDGVDTNDLTNLNNIDSIYQYADDIPFILNYDLKCKINFKNNDIKLYQQNRKTMNYENINITYFNTPYKIGFKLPCEQYKKYYSKHIINNIKNNKIYLFNFIENIENQYAYDIKLYRYINNTYEEWTEFKNLNEMNSLSKGFIVINNNGYHIQFGDSINGIQPNNDDIFYIEYKLTYGSKGNIIPYSINKSFDYNYKIGTDIINIPFIIQNDSKIDGGQDEYNVDELKQSIIQYIKSKNVLSTEQDFKDIKKFKHNNFKLSTGILERSDILDKSILLYNVMEFKNTLCKIQATNLKIKFDSTSFINEKFKQFYQCSNELIDVKTNPKTENQAYLFDMILQYDTNTVDYLIYQNKQFNSIVSQIIPEDNFKLLSIDSELYYNDNDIPIYKFKINTNLNDSDYDSINQKYELSINIFNKNKTTKYNIPYSNIALSADNGQLKYEFEAEQTNINYDENLFIFELKDSTSKNYYFESHLSLINILSDIMKSYMEFKTESGTKYLYIYNVPTIDIDYINNIQTFNSIEEFKSELYNNIFSLDLSKNSILNYNIKFQNTDGEISKLNYRGHKYVINDIITSPIIPDMLNEKYLISYSEFDNFSPYYEQLNNIITIYGENDYDYIIPQENDIIFIKSKNMKLIYTGSQWKELKCSIPLSIEVDVYVDNYNLNYIEILKDQIYDSYSNKFNLDINILKNDILSIVLQNKFVKNQKIKKPEFDIILDFDLPNEYKKVIHKQYIYFRKNDIKINLIKGM